MTKILFLIPNLMHGGAEKVLVNLVNNLDQSKYDVTLYSIFDEGVNKQFLKSHVKYRSYFKKVFRGNSQIMKLFSPRFLFRFFIKDDYDILVSFLEGPAARIIAGCTHSNSRKIAWIHTEMTDEKLGKTGFRSLREARKLYEKFDHIAGVSKNVTVTFKKNVTDKVPVSVMYNVNETEQIIDKGKASTDRLADDTTIKICSAGKIVKVKGFDRLLEVHQRLLHEGLKHEMCIIGKGAEQNALGNKARQLGLSDSFRFLGFDENPYRFISKADLYVCSSLREGFSTAVTEALILGVPCISTDVSGARELLGENDEYGMVTENNTEALYQGIKEMLTDSEKLSYYRKQAKARGELFSKEHTVKAVENLLDELL